jgi:DNA-binding NarL/FixJ family response regulator
VRSAKVLVVEDFELFRRTIVSKLQQSGEFDVTQASDGLEAVQKAEQFQPDLVLLDVGLPGLNGMRAAKRIRELAPHAKILFLSQEFSSGFVQEAFRLGALGYLHKELMEGELGRAVHRVLGDAQFVSGHLTDNRLMASHGSFHHEAQFYDHEATLLESVTELVQSALKTGNAAVVVATERHRSSLLEKLTSLGFEPGRIEADGRLVLLDAAEMLSKILVDRMPDPGRFSEVIGGRLAKAKSSAPVDQSCVTVFGEMVALLWADGDCQATIRLEQLWNELASRLPFSFSLRCAYPTEASHKTENGQMIRSVCPLHSTIHSL